MTPVATRAANSAPGDGCRCAPVMSWKKSVTGKWVKEMVGRDGIAPPTPGFSVLSPGPCKVCRSVVIVRWSGVQCGVTPVWWRVNGFRDGHWTTPEGDTEIAPPWSIVAPEGTERSPLAWVCSKIIGDRYARAEWRRRGLYQPSMKS